MLASRYRACAAFGSHGKVPRTREALRQYQQARGLTVSGELEQQTLSALGIGTAVGATPGAGGVGTAPRY